MLFRHIQWSLEINLDYQVERSTLEWTEVTSCFLYCSNFIYSGCGQSLEIRHACRHCRQGKISLTGKIQTSEVRKDESHFHFFLRCFQTSNITYKTTERHWKISKSSASVISITLQPTRFTHVKRCTDYLVWGYYTGITPFLIVENFLSMQV